MKYLSLAALGIPQLALASELSTLMIFRLDGDKLLTRYQPLTFDSRITDQVTAPNFLDLIEENPMQKIWLQNQMPADEPAEPPQAESN